MKWFLLVGGLVIGGMKTYGQNLVPNGSFEDYYSCPIGLNRVDSCVGWHHYGGLPYLEGTPDYFDSCTTAYTNAVPDNVLGSQLPFDGSSYMGIITFDWTYWGREYIGAKLIDTLVPGNNYAVSMRVSRGDARPTYTLYACVASNHMGIRFTTVPYSQGGGLVPINNYAQLDEDSIITDSTNWVLLHWNFIADSAYSHIYIGNFFESNSTDTVRIDCPITYGLQAYYYIDSVTLRCIDANCATGIELSTFNSQLSISPNPATTSIQLHLPSNHSTTLTLFNLLGEKVKEQTITGSNITIDVSELPAGMYVVRVEGWSGKFVKE